MLVLLAGCSAIWDDGSERGNLGLEEDATVAGDPDAAELDALVPSPSAWNGWYRFFYCTTGDCGECTRLLPRAFVVDVLQLPDGSGSGTVGFDGPACEADRPLLLVPVTATAEGLSNEQQTCVCHQADGSCTATLASLVFVPGHLTLAITSGGEACVAELTLGSPGPSPQ